MRWLNILISSWPLTNPTYFAAKLVQDNRKQGNLGRTGTTSSQGSASRLTPSSSSASFKKAPPPPPGASSHVDPPPVYTPNPQGNGAASSASAKRAPPPPPAVKPKPRPSVQHVVALYDFVAQVSFLFFFSLSHFMRSYI